MLKIYFVSLNILRDLKPHLRSRK